MAFSLSFAGVQVTITASASTSNNNNANFCIKGVKHFDDGHIEAEVCNFNGTITISEDSLAKFQDEEDQFCTRSREVVVDAIPEGIDCALSVTGADETAKDDTSCGATEHHASSLSVPESEPYVPPKPSPGKQLTVDIDSDDGGEEKKMQSPLFKENTEPIKGDGGGGVRFSDNKPEVIFQEERPQVDLSLHMACASDEMEITNLRELLKSKPELASVEDDFGDYPAHVFANNDSFIYTDCDVEVQQFLFELYAAFPGAFFSEGYYGQIPFAGVICDWVDDCHQLYARDHRDGVFRVSEIKTLTKSTRVINSLCVREEVQKLTSLPANVRLTPKVAYSFKMLSYLLDKLGDSAIVDISARREFWMVASKRRDKIIGSVASLPFLVRTILLIENKTERDALLELSIVKNAVFRPESVDLWLVALLSGGERARACAVDYLCLVSRLSLSGLFGRRMHWSEGDTKRFHSSREQLYKEIGKLDGFLPCMLHLGESLYDVSTRRAVKYVVESTIGRPFPVYLMFFEMFMLLILMTTYRIIVELVYAMPSEQYLSQYREFWALAFSIAVFFATRDLAILFSFMSTEEKLARKYALNFGNFIGYATTACVIGVLSVLHVNSSIEGRNFVGIVSGLLWWKFLLHVKGMSQNLSTLIYTIMQIAGTLKYFLAVFLISIFFFADMVDIVKKTSGECDFVDGEIEGSLETFCSLTPLQTYLSMYAIMIGGVEISALEGSSALICLLFVAASFSGVIVLVNILIAIVTGEYEKAQERSCFLFARARLETAAKQVARERVFNPPDDPTSGILRKVWRITAKLKYLALIAIVEYYLIKSLISCSSLHKDGVIGDFLYVALILCAILHHIFVTMANLYFVVKAICNWESLRWLRGSKFHLILLKMSLMPVCRYLQSIGLGKGEKCPDASDVDVEDRPLSLNEFVGKQAHFGSNIEEAIRASETRILYAMKSMMMLQIPPE